MSNQKKMWIMPEITMLVRNETDESVLCHCKTHAWSGDPNAGPERSSCWTGRNDGSCQGGSTS